MSERGGAKKNKKTKKNEIVHESGAVFLRMCELVHDVCARSGGTLRVERPGVRGAHRGRVAESRSVQRACQSTATHGGVLFRSFSIFFITVKFYFVCISSRAASYRVPVLVLK